MDYVSAGKLRDYVESVTTETTITPSHFYADTEVVEERYLVALVRCRNIANPWSDYLVELYTGCGTPDCWMEVPPAGFMNLQRSSKGKVVA